MPFQASGQTAVIRPYRKNVMRRANGENKVRFDVYSEATREYVQSCFAFASASVAQGLHRQNHYRVLFNTDPKYPQIIEIVEPVSLP